MQTGVSVDQCLPASLAPFLLLACVSGLGLSSVRRLRALSRRQLGELSLSVGEDVPACILHGRAAPHRPARKRFLSDFARSGGSRVASRLVSVFLVTAANPLSDPCCPCVDFGLQGTRPFAYFLVGLSTLGAEELVADHRPSPWRRDVFRCFRLVTLCSFS